MGSPLEEIRTKYLDYLREVILEENELRGPCRTEIVVRPDDDEPEEAFRCYRVDVGDEDDPESAVDANAAPIRVEAELPDYEVPVRVGEVTWNDLEIRVSGSEAPVEAIVAWAGEWLDLGETRAEDEDGFHGVAHSVLRPSERDGGYAVNVDMGSAPVEALEALLRIVAEGAERVEIGTSGAID